MSDKKKELRVKLERVPPPKGPSRQRARNTDTSAAVSQGGTDTHRVVPSSSNETRQASAVESGASADVERQRARNTDTGAAVSQGGTDTHRVVPSSSNETRQASTVESGASADEEVVPADITYPSKSRPEGTQNEQQPVRATIRPHRPHRCDLCSISFNNQLELKRHQDVHHAQRPFVCKSCHKIFIRKGILHLHLRLRSEDRPFYCAACSRNFRRTGGVKTPDPTPDSEQS